MSRMKIPNVIERMDATARIEATVAWLTQAPGSAGLDRKCRNGDTGRDLYRRLRESEDRLVELRKQAQRIKSMLIPLEESIESESISLSNVETRINIWRQEQNDKVRGGAND